MATQVIFHLGNHPELSAAELEAVLSHTVEHEGNVALSRLPEGTTPQGLMGELGGCIKMSEIVRVGGDPMQTVIETLQTQVPEGKIEFGLNVYPFDKKRLAEGIRTIKEELKAAGRSVRFLNQDENLPSATIEKSGILKKGTDINIVRIGSRTFVTRTIAVQPFDTYRSRDYEKPARLPHDGMLPPKLAQMMINLTGKRLRFASALLYDPFCGSGTVLGEALRKGMNVMGSDVNAKAVSAAKKNLEALSTTLPSPGFHRLFVKDARTLTARDLPALPDLVVSELNLGPPLTRPASLPRIEGIQNNLMPLYRDFLTSLSTILKPGTPVVLAFPLHYTPTLPTAPFDNPSKSLQFRVHAHTTHVAKRSARSPYDLHLSPHPLRRLNQTLQDAGFKTHLTLTYHRPGQAVGREIRVLEKK